MLARLAALAVITFAAEVTAGRLVVAGDGSGGCCIGGGLGGGAAERGPSPSVTAWVRNPADQVRPPGGVSASSCGPWRPINTLADTGTDAFAGQAVIPAGVGADAREYRQWWRDCPGGGQAVWAAVFSPEDLVPVAAAQMRSRLPRPTVGLSPDANVGGFVALQTWLGVDPMPPVSATAGPTFGGLTVTATAVPSHIEWTPGDPTVGRIICELWGQTRPEGAPSGSAPCGWTPQVPSAPQYGGGRDENFHGSVTVVWTASWTASTGESGSLDELSTSTDVTYRVREIQTIGEDR
jgi:hypothetical protein